MTSKSVPIYRHGRKFYVSNKEYERMRSEERRQRCETVKNAHRTPVRSPSTSLYNPIQRSHSNPYDHKYGILTTPHLPVNSLLNTNYPRESNRLSRPTSRYYNDQDDLSSITSAISKKKSPSPIRSTSSDKIVNIRRTPLSSDTDNDIKRSFSAEISQLSSLSQQKQQTQIPLRRTIPTTISDYGMSPVTTFSMTPTDQTHTQTSPSKLTSYFTRMKQSSLNPPSKPSPSAISGTGSLLETGMQGSNHAYTILGSSNRRTGTNSSSSLLTRSSSDNSKNEYYHRDTTSGSFSDENSSSLLTLTQRQRNPTTNRPRGRSEYQAEIDDDYNQPRDSWTRSTMRSQSSDGLTEKKRVRFADMEGFTLETTPDKNQLKSTINNRLLTRRQHINVSSDSRDPPQPFYNALYQTATRVGESKLATDV